MLWFAETELFVQMRGEKVGEERALAFVQHMEVTAPLNDVKECVGPIQASVSTSDVMNSGI